MASKRDPLPGCKNDPRAGTPPLGGQTGRAGAGQPGEEKAEGRLQSSCQGLEGPARKTGTGFLAVPFAVGQGAMVLN